MMANGPDWLTANRIDIHNHVWGTGLGAPRQGALNRRHAESLLARATRLGIDYLCVSAP